MELILEYGRTATGRVWMSAQVEFGEDQELYHLGLEQALLTPIKGDYGYDLSSLPEAPATLRGKSMQTYRFADASAALQFRERLIADLRRVIPEWKEIPLPQDETIVL